MSALAVLYLVLPFPVAFLLHDAEEAFVQHRWMSSHEQVLQKRFPRLGFLFEHLSRLNTRAFVIAALEEFVVLLCITAYVLVQGSYAAQVWSALFMAFAIHLLVHIGQSVALRGYVPGLASTIILLPYVAYGVWSIWLAMGGTSIILLSIAGFAAMVINLFIAHRLGITLTTKRTD